MWDVKPWTFPKAGFPGGGSWSEVAGRVKARTGRLAAVLLDILYPCRCMTCGSFLGPDKDLPRPEWDLLSFPRLLHPFFCRRCAEGFVPVVPPLCPACGLPFRSREGESHLCARCIEQANRFGLARAAGVYEGTLMEAVHLFKYAGKTCLARPLSLLMKRTFLDNWAQEGIDLAVPVPLHTRRLRKRGFNQAERLVRGWNKTGKERGPFPPVAPLVLERSRWTHPQTGLGVRERARNVRHAFRTREPEKVHGKRILLVDDVLTTGATVNECARALLHAGAARVDVLTLARAPR